MLKKIIYTLLLTLVSFITKGQVLTQTYIDPCDSKTYIVTFPVQSQAVMVIIRNEYKSFSYTEAASGAVYIWVNQVLSKPCPVTSSKFSSIIRSERSGIKRSKWSSIRSSKWGRFWSSIISSFRSSIEWCTTTTSLILFIPVFLIIWLFIFINLKWGEQQRRKQFKQRIKNGIQNGK